MKRYARYVQLSELSEAQKRRYHATLAEKRRQYPHAFKGEAAAAGLRARIKRDDDLRTRPDGEDVRCTCPMDAAGSISYTCPIHGRPAPGLRRTATNDPG